MARDPRQLREDAAAAASAGKHKRALECYLELERQEPRDAQWPKRAAEMLRRLGKTKEAIAAYDRAADRYTSGGFLVQAIAVCKLILQLDPTHQETQLRLSAINELQGTASTRIGELAETNVALHDTASVAALRDDRAISSLTTRMPPIAGTLPPPLGDPHRSPSGRGVSITTPPATEPPVPSPPILPRTRTPQQRSVAIPRTITPANVPRTMTPTDPSMPRTRTGNQIPIIRPTRNKPSTPPIELAPGTAIEQVELGSVMPGAYDFRDDETSGIIVIPLDANFDEAVDDEFETETDTYQGVLAIEVQPMEDSQPAIIVERPSSVSIGEMEIDEPGEEIDLADLEEVPLAEPRLIGAPARRALQQTPLFAGLPMETLDALISEIEIVSLTAGEMLFREGDPGDALFVISEGEVAISSEGPPRVEMSRLGPGAFFGEVSLVTDQPRTATVTAIQPTELLRVDRDALAAVLRNHPDILRVVLRFVRDRLVDRLVRTSPFFRPFEESERRELADRFQFLEIERGATILTAGARADGLYIVLAGQVEVRHRDGVRLGPGDLVGETSLLTGEKVSHPVVAVGKCLALCLPAAQFRELIMTHPHVLEYVGEQAERRRKVRMI